MPHSETAGEFLASVERAIRDSILAIERFKEEHREAVATAAVPPTRVNSEEEYREYLNRLSPDVRENIHRGLGRQRQLSREAFSCSVQAFGLLQIALLGMRRFASSEARGELPDSVLRRLGARSAKSGRLSDYCHGRRLGPCSVHIGLLVYAARNVHAHLDSLEELRAANKAILEALSEELVVESDEGWEWGAPSDRLYLPKSVMAGALGEASPKSFLGRNTTDDGFVLSELDWRNEALVSPAWNAIYLMEWNDPEVCLTDMRSLCGVSVPSRDAGDSNSHG